LKRRAKEIDIGTVGNNSLGVTKTVETLKLLKFSGKLKKKKPIEIDFSFFLL